MSRVAVLSLLLAALVRAPQVASVPLAGRAEVAFSPHGGATRLVERAIHSAHHTIRVQAYAFTSVPIANALVAAQRAGVRVEVLLDRTSLRHHYRAVRVLWRAHIPLWLDYRVRIAHSKVLILDRTGIVTGSFNFTYAAARDNSENVLWIQHAPALAARYLADFRWRRSLSRALKPPD